ncbi:hypothetical protein [Streptomyces sp. NPDC050738]|uniref:hypothetical protein n=1 Tax=Streptomyces sp. NPDC050738 TaxID=3154744 RepID=UPI0034493DBA
MSKRHTGRHLGRRTESGSDPRPEVHASRRTATAKKAALWVMMLSCSAFILWAVYAAVVGWNSLDDPPPDEDHLCSGQSRTCEP